MKAFVRFKIIAEGTDDEQFIAWFEPEHYTLERTATFFARRFAGMKWGIVTPYRSASWDKKSITFSEGGTKADVPDNDALEDAWRIYYASIFNPARLKVSMMKSEMPMKYWKNLPEASLIQNLVRDAKQSEQDMIARAATQPPSRHLIYQQRNPSPTPQTLQDLSTLSAINRALQSCANCPLAQQATQAVPGIGPANASVVFIGEQPGDEEDLAGTPFVGPAGKVFDAALAKAHISRETIYITNAVKHFKFITKAKKRIHQTPNSNEINACNFWLNHELDVIKPKLIVAMGATAAQSLMGKAVKLSDIRSQFFVQEDGSLLFITVHPSYLLRIPDTQKAKAELEKFNNDFLEIAAQINAFNTPALIRS